MFKDDKSFGEPPRPDLSKPTLAGLSYLLRHLPEGFEWRYTSCQHCAMGLAATQWEPEKLSEVCGADMSRMFSLSPEVARYIFYSQGYSSKPTAEDIADLIDSIGSKHFAAKMDAHRELAMF
jgi:hypothetical protein